MNKITTFLLVIVMALSISLMTTIQSKAQNRSFPGVIPFTTSSDRLGFFDQSSGKIYVYDPYYSQCVFSGQLNELGKAIVVQTAGTNNNTTTNQ